ncbi:MAG: IS256 family transposase [Bacteroides sp.]
MEKDFDFESFKAEALKQMYAGRSLTGKDGVLAPLLENLLNAALEGEMDAHMSEEEREFGNRRNGRIPKHVQSSIGELTIDTPRDREGTFDPQIVRKRERILADSLSDRIIGMYAIGTSTRDISNALYEQFGNRISAESISAITDRILPEVQSWRNRSLDAVYPIVWMDAIHYKVMDDKMRPVTRAIYNVLALDSTGHKELLGMYIAKSEGANFWLSVLTDLQNRGVQDILIACVDGLKGFPDAITSVFPDTVVQLCVIHQIRNSMKYIASKHQKEFMKELKPVYQAVNRDAAECALLELDAKWGEQYPIVLRSWQDNWERLSAYFEYTEPIRRIIYTTNTVEGYHRQLRKVTKNKGVFSSDTALEKLVYLAYTRIRRKWTQPIHDWGQTAQQLAIKFGERFRLM